MKQPVILCRELNRGTVYFYVAVAGEEYYLFGQPYRTTVWKRYRTGVPLDEALDFGRCGQKPVLEKVAEKLPSFLRYVEKEYGVKLLRGKKKTRQNRREEEEEEITAA